MNNSFVSKDVAVEVASCLLKLPNGGLAEREAGSRAFSCASFIQRFARSPKKRGSPWYMPLLP